MCTNPIELESLENLKADLLELLSLTKETLNEDQQQSENDSGDDPFADEMRLFMSEITETDRQEENTNTKTDDNTNETFDEKFNRIKSELKSMIGQKCIAPHTHTWGSIAYHNAFICGLDETAEYSSDDHIADDSIRIRILFTNPTHQEMIPCSYYLDGDCKFDSEKCRFSHGELVKRCQLRTYVEPNFSLLSSRRCPVLAKQSDRLWYKGCTISSDFDQRTCRIKIDSTKKEVTCNFEDILPIVDDNDNTSSSSDDDDREEAAKRFEKELQQSKLIEKSLLTPVADQPLGDWEKHTKGFGSKMMQKYGYIIGTGLGQNGEGIIVPIGAQILPPGRSLDHCMALREQANGDEDLFSVERKLKKQQRRQEKINQRTYAREQKQSQSDVFKFINESVSAVAATAGFSNGLSKTNTFDTQPSSTSTSSLSSMKSCDLKSHSQKHLNVASLQLAENIRRKERDIEKLKESMGRHQIGTPMHKKLNEQMQTMNYELAQLKRSESNVSNEQIFRKNKSKLSVF